MKTITKWMLMAAFACSSTMVSAQVPPVAPPDLEYPAEDVLSFFSEKYGEAYPNMNAPSWGQTATYDYTATGDETAGLLVLRDLGWLPIALNATAEIKSYEYVHVDVFCNEETMFQIGFHRHYPDTKEQYFPLIEKGTMKAGKWYSIDYPMADFLIEWGSNGAHYLRFGGEGEGLEYSDEIYITNFVCFNGKPTCLGGVVRGESAGLNDNVYAADLQVYISGQNMLCKASENIKSVSLYNVLGQAVKTVSVNQTSATIDVADLTDGMYVVLVEFANGQTVSRKIVK